MVTIYRLNTETGRHGPCKNLVEGLTVPRARNVKLAYLSPHAAGKMAKTQLHLCVPSIF